MIYVKLCGTVHEGDFFNIHFFFSLQIVILPCSSFLSLYLLWVCKSLVFCNVKWLMRVFTTVLPSALHFILFHLILHFYSFQCFNIVSRCFLKVYGFFSFTPFEKFLFFWNHSSEMRCLWQVFPTFSHYIFYKCIFNMFQRF